MMKNDFLDKYFDSARSVQPLGRLVQDTEVDHLIHAGSTQASSANTAVSPILKAALSKPILSFVSVTSVVVTATLIAAVTWFAASKTGNRSTADPVTKPMTALQKPKAQSVQAQTDTATTTSIADQDNSAVVSNTSQATSNAEIVQAKHTGRHTSKIQGSHRLNNDKKPVKDDLSEDTVDDTVEDPLPANSPPPPRPPIGGGINGLITTETIDQFNVRQFSVERLRATSRQEMEGFAPPPTSSGGGSQSVPQVVTIRRGIAMRTMLQDTTTKQDREVPPFTRVQTMGPVDVKIICGKPGQSVSIAAPETLLPMIKTVVKESTLSIYLEDTTHNYMWEKYDSKQIVITINAPSLRYVGLAGSGDAEIMNNKSDSFKIIIAGSGDVSASEIVSKNLGVIIAGSGDAKISGETDNFKLNIAGSGDVQAGNMKAREIKAVIAGSGNAIVYSSETITASVAGSGDILYKGNPKHVDASSIGSGEVKPAK